MFPRNLVAAVLAFAVVVAWGAPGRSDPAPDQVASLDVATATTSSWPVRLSKDRGHLQDPSGRPVLLVGDTGWSGAVAITAAEAGRYLDDRKARGVNVVVVNLIEHEFSSQDPPWRNSNGRVPFPNVDDFTVRNGGYFDDVETLVREGLKRNIGFLLAPAYMGAGCGDEGWCAEMRANGTARLRNYGIYLGKRFAKYPNVIWMHGGDYYPSDDDLELVKAVRDGIIAGGAKQIHTYHYTPESPPAGDPRLDRINIDTVYSYRTGALAQVNLQARSRNAGKRPFIFIEGVYENEHGSRPVNWREQFYTTMLAGGAGFVFGNNPIWYFWQPGDRDYGFGDGGFPKGWTQALGSAGARNLTYAARFFRSIRWYALIPDLSHKLVTAGMGQPGDAAFVLASWTSDRRLGVVYFPRTRTVTLDTSGMAGSARAWWYNPATGAYTELKNSPLPRKKIQLTSPSARGDGSSDWLLLLKVTG